MPEYLDRYRNYMRQGVEAGRGSIEEQRQFDPMQYARQASEAQFSDFSEELKKQIGDLRGSQVGMGRLDTGFATRDEDRLYSEAYEDLTDAVAGRAMQAGRMEMSNRANAADRYMSMLRGGMDQEMMLKNAAQRRKGGLFGTLGSVAGGLAGTFLLPGIGTAAGAQLGGQIGRTAGSYMG